MAEYNPRAGQFSPKKKKKRKDEPEAVAPVAPAPRPETFTQPREQGLHPDVQRAMSSVVAFQTGKVKPSLLQKGGANTMVRIGTDPDTKRSLAMSEALNYVTSIYGDGVTPWIAAAFESDPEKRRAEYEFIRKLTSPDYKPIVTMTPRGQRVLTGKETVTKERLALGEKVRKVAEQKGLKVGREKAVLADVFEIATLLASEDFRSAFTEKELDEMDAALDSLPGEEPDLIEIDEQMAKNNPAKAVAMLRMYQARYPEAEVRIGNKGIVGHAFDALGGAFDTLLSPLSVAAQWAGEESEERAANRDVPEELEFLHPKTDQGKAAREAARLRKDLEEGKVPQDRWAEAMQDLAHLEDEADIGVPGGWEGAWNRALHPKTAGFALAESIVQGHNILPGDPGYEGITATVGLLTGIYLDPLSALGRTVKGLRLANEVPAGVVGSRFAPLTEKALAAAVKGGVRETSELLSKRSWAIFDDVGAKVERYLHKRGFKTVRVDNGRGLLVYGLDGKRAANVAERFGHAEVLSADGIIDVGRKTVARADWTATTRPGTTARPISANVPGVGRVNANAVMDTANPVSLVPAPLSRSHVVNWVYRKNALTVQEFGLTAEARQAADELFERMTLAGNTEADRLGLLVSAHPELDPTISKALASARNADEVQDVIVEALAGGFTNPVDRLRALERIKDIRTQVEKGVSPAREVDLLAEEVYLNDVLRAEEAVLPLRTFPDKAFLRQVRRLAPAGGKLSSHEKLIFAALGMGKVERGQNVAQNFLRTARRAFVDTIPARKRIVYRVASERVKAGELADIHIESAKNIRDYGRFLKVPEKVIQRNLAGYVTALSKGDAFEAAKQMFEEFAENSRLLDPVGKAHFRQFSGRLSSLRHPAETLHGANYEGTLHKMIPAAGGGDDIPSGMIAFTGDGLQSLTLPSLQELKTYTSRLGKIVTGMEAKGKHAGLARSLRGVRAVRDTMTNFWKSAVLMSKMPLSLISRIVLEEQFRMAATDYASMVRHPGVWWKSVEFQPGSTIGGVSRFKFAGDDFARFAGSHDNSLGAVVDFTKERGGFQGKKRIVIEGMVEPPGAAQLEGLTGLDYYNKGKDYFNAVSGYAARRAANISSPETKILLTSTPENFLTWARSEKSSRWGGVGVGDDILRRIENSAYADNPVEAVRRMRAELDGFMAKGVREDGTVIINEKVRDSLLTGHMVDEVVDASGFATQTSVKVGTDAYARALARLSEAGEWSPTIRVNRELAAFVDDVDETFFGSFRDRMFNAFYSGPDITLSRGPMFSQMARREFDRLKGLGWGEKRAQDAAEAYAARGTSDYMFEVGVKTSAQNWARNIFPFFPAWQELLETWLVRIPSEMSAPVLGHAVLGRKVQVYTDFFRGVGGIQKDANGQDYFIVPGLDKVWKAWTGTSLDVNLKFPVKSLNLLFGAGIGPGLGPVESGTLAALSRKFDGVIDDIAGAALPYGNYGNLGPASINNIFYAFGEIPPWERLTTPDYQQHQLNMSFVDGFRMAAQEFGPAPQMPKREAFATDAAYDTAINRYRKEHTNWSRNVLIRGQELASFAYGTRAMAGMWFPVVPQITSATEEEITALYRSLNAFEDGGEIRYPAMDAFKAANPDAWFYTQGKTVNLSGQFTFGDYDEFLKAWTKGNIISLPAEDYVQWAYGMQSRQLMLAQRRAALDEVGTTGPELLLNSYKKKEVLDRHRQNWDAFEFLHTETDPSKPRKFGNLFQQYGRDLRESYAESDSFSEELEQEKLLATLDGLNSIGRLFTVGGIRDGDYKAIRRELYDKLEGDVPSKNPQVRAINSWYATVADPYYAKIEELHNKVRAIPKDSKTQTGPIYDEMRRLSNSMQATKGIDGEMYPTPEEVAFAALSPQEQELRRLEWATRKPEWLTNFQRKTVYGADEPTPKAQAYFDFVNEQDQALNKQVVEENISTSSKEYDALVASVEKRIAAKAKRLGVENLDKLRKEPVYKRLADQPGFKDNASFKALTQWVDLAHEQAKSMGYSARGRTAPALYVQGYIFKLIDKGRETEPEFDRLMGLLETAFAEPNKEKAPTTQTYYPVFFNLFSYHPDIQGTKYY